ncbi:conserved hypothetical protein [uncultured delta proteobacterium]|uniref:Tetratricopeptide repeat protein n=1 Tax=uncultured delta proteobacterium TaxID=34034 RepID=A0A212J3U7_9DELT|nr:conserved hypothetical protein [uncultured delta proteobacterium]
MKQKIEWYREVLEIEPNSKIFFPLARMLAKDGRPDEAIAVLRQGVGRHPDHVEARLFLAELLYSSGKAIELQQEVAVLSVLFKNYPGFWRAWGERLFDEESTRDAGLAAIFLAAFLQNLPVSWAGVIEHGLKNLVGGSPARPSATVAETYPLAASAASLEPDLEAIAEMLPAAAAPATRQEGSIPATLREPSPEPSYDENEDETDEPITLRTRSMADVLAEQGDVAGALDIYAELLAAASSEAVKKDLKARMDALAGAPQGGESDAQASKEEKKDWLAVLAQRLEARSLQ